MSEDVSSISVIIPAYNSSPSLPKLLDSLAKQTLKPKEIMVVDDCSNDNTIGQARTCPVTLIQNDRNRGPAYSRNRGILESRGEILAFVDADCVCAVDWIEKTEQAFSDSGTNVVVGKVLFHPQSLLSNAIHDLGWPGGGNVGFEKIWKVDKDGRTKHITSGNFAARRKIFETCGVFNEGFPCGGEDVELSERWTHQGAVIYFRPEIQIVHSSMDSFSGFMKWHFYRGRSNVYVHDALGSKRSSLLLFEKVKVFGRIILNSLKRLSFFLVVPLMVIMFFCQLLGYLTECLMRVFKSYKGAHKK